MDTIEAKSQTLELVQSEDFRSVYANPVQFEASVWDLKLRFGQTDQKVAMNAVIEHTAVTLPWPQVKILVYLMQVNVVVHEQLNGRINVPPGIIPTTEAIQRGAAAFRDSEGVAKVMLELYNAFVENNPEAAGEGYVSVKPKAKK